MLIAISIPFGRQKPKHDYLKGCRTAASFFLLADAFIVVSVGVMVKYSEITV